MKDEKYLSARYPVTRAPIKNPPAKNTWFRSASQESSQTNENWDKGTTFRLGQVNNDLTAKLIKTCMQVSTCHYIK